MVSALFLDEFFHDRRGPELQCVHWSHEGRILSAIDYLNPDHAGAKALRHARFDRVHVVMVTPEAVVDYGRLGDHFAELRPAAMVDLGRSTWLESFSPRHVAKCRHVQLMFYDELFDVICEGVACHAGAFTR